MCVCAHVRTCGVRCQVSGVQVYMCVQVGLNLKVKEQDIQDAESVLASLIAAGAGKDRLL